MLSTISINHDDIEKSTESEKKNINKTENISEDKPKDDPEDKPKDDSEDKEKDDLEAKLKEKLEDNNKPNVIINNIININDDKLIVEYDETKKMYIFYNTDKEFIGSFTVEELIKYIIYDIDDNFLKYTSISSKEIIEKYICVLDQKTGTIKLHTHLESSFMGSIELLIQLYNILEDYKITNLELEILKIGDNKKKIIEQRYNNFIYLLLSHILKLIAVVNEMVTENDKRNALLWMRNGTGCLSSMMFA